MSSTTRRTIWTIGHSTLPLGEFIARLAAHGVRAVADVRRYPGSRRHPHFAGESLASSLPQHGLKYVHFPALGGRRTPAADSINTGWRNSGFRAYADYMLTHEFTAALEELEGLARQFPAALMCAEAVPWRCHRSLIGDALLVRGWEVIDIYTGRKSQPHRLTPVAQVEGTRITYPAAAGSGLVERGGARDPCPAGPDAAP
jgi:uncharacterized protein (DUF488 family)